MWTELNTKNMVLAKPYKQFLQVCREKLKAADLDTWTTITNDSKESGLWIVPIISYAAAKTLNRDSESALATNLSPHMLEVLSERIAEATRTKSTNKGLKEDEDRIPLELKRALGPNRYAYYYMPFFTNIILEKEEVGAGIIAEVLTMAWLTCSDANSGGCPLCNIFNQYLMILYWWAYKNGFYDTYFKYAKVSPKLKGLKTARPKDGETAREFTSRMYNTKIAQQLMLDIFEVSVNNSFDFFYNNIDRYVNGVIEQLKLEENRRISFVYDTVLNSVLSKDFDITGVNINAYIDKRKKTKYIAYILSQCVTVPFELYDYDSDSILLYIEYLNWEKPGKKVMGVDRATQFKSIFIMHARLSQFTAYSQYIGTYYYGLPSVVKRLESEIESNKGLEAKVESFRNKSDSFRAQYKRAELECKKLKSEISSLNSTISKLEGQVASDMSKNDIENLIAEHKSLTAKLSDGDNKLGECQRTVSKLQKKIEKLTKLLDDSETEALKAMEERDRLQSLANELALHRIFNEIPIECFVNAIKKYNILLIGGDMMHEKLRLYGLNNISYAKGGCRDLGRSDVISKDLVVVATTYLDHSTTEFLPKQMKANPNIKYLKYNNANADGLVYEMFKILYQQ